MELLEQKILEMIDNGYEPNQLDGLFCEELQSRSMDYDLSKKALGHFSKDRGVSSPDGKY